MCRELTKFLVVGGVAFFAGVTAGTVYAAIHEVQFELDPKELTQAPPNQPRVFSYAELHLEENSVGSVDNTLLDP